MSKRNVTIASGLLLAAVAGTLLYLYLARDRDTIPGSMNGAKTEARDLRPHTLRGEARSPDAPRLQPEVDAGELGAQEGADPIVIEVVDEASVPIQHAEVTWHLPPFLARNFEISACLPVHGPQRTDGGGKVVFAHPPAHAPLLAVVRKEGFAEFWEKPLRAGDRVQVVLGRTCGVQGKVADEAGRRIEALLVLQGNHTVEELKAERGEFDLGGLAAGDWRLTAVHPDYEEVSTDLKLLPGQVLVKDVSLRPGGTLRGTVLSEAGTPLGGVRIGLTDSHHPGTTSDAGGRFTLTGLPSAFCVAFHMENAVTIATVSLGEEKHAEREFRLWVRDASVKVNLTVMKETRGGTEPLRHGAVEIHDLGPSDFPYRGISDGDGVLRFATASTRNDLAVVVYGRDGKGFAGASDVSFPLWTANGSTLEAVVVLKPLAQVGGVVMGDGRPLGSAIVTLQAGTGTKMILNDKRVVVKYWGLRLGEARTDGNGTFLIQDMQSGDLTVKVSHQDHPTLFRTTTLRPGSNDLFLDLPPASRQALEFIDQSTGEPIWGLGVRVEAYDEEIGEVLRTGRTDSRGRVMLGALPEAVPLSVSAGRGTATGRASRSRSTN